MFNTITKTKKKSFEEYLSLNFEESNLKVNRNTSHSASALISKGGMSSKTNNSIKQSGLACPLTNSKDIAPGNEVSVKFAAKQLFQILLVHVKYIHSKSVSDLETLPVLSESNPLIINL